MFLTIKETEDNSISILVVDDEPVYRKVMKRLLIKEGHRVTLAEDGIDGLRILKNKEFDIVLTDINMPNMNGWDFLRNIEELYPDIPAAIITGLSGQEKIHSEERSMAKRILKKPISFSEIRK
ncbi:response regulator [Candidatus Marinimicrobia bacterium MT.SAG.4]|nr:response regulator [Candidatus Marinimicrobia bacterium MT.SAG.4]